MAARASQVETNGLWSDLKVVFARMSAKRRRQFYFVLLLMLAGAVAELATIGAVVPFLALLAERSPGSGHGGRLLSHFIPSGGDPVIVAAVMFVAFSIVAGIVRVQLAWSSRNFILHFGNDLAVEIQRRVLLQPYSFHIHRNSSSLLASLDKTEVMVMDVLLPLMHALTGGVIALFVVAVLIAINPLATAAAVVAFVTIYAAASAVTRSRLSANSIDVNVAHDERMQTVQESLGGIRDVIIDNSQSVYLRAFSKTNSRLATARVVNQFIASAPRALIEMAGMIVIAAIALVIARESGGIAAAIPVLGALALGAQRLLPLIQQVYVGWSSAVAQRAIFSEVVALLELPVPEEASEPVEPIRLENGITFDHVSFTYQTRRSRTLDDVSLTIPSGSMVALVGPTGTGKSTLVDLLMGLLDPDEGLILVDGCPLSDENRRRWQRSIAHVPQSIFLADTTIANNIAISRPHTGADREAIVESSKKAHLHAFVTTLPDGYDTYIGERGIRLSGGQRQRLGIARAIYKNAPVFIFDEATSALDDATEAAVIETFDELRRQGRTIIIVAHRLSTIRHCDLVVRLDRGRLAEPTNFEAVAGSRSLS